MLSAVLPLRKHRLLSKLSCAKIRIMKTQHTLPRILIFLLVLILASLGCNLTAEPPATLAPRLPNSTLTPQNPIGPSATLQIPIATNAPLPSTVNSALPSSTDVQSQLQQIDSTRMMTTIRDLINFHNRHTFAEPAADRGAFAASLWLQQQLQGYQAANPQTNIQVFPLKFSFDYGGQTRTAENVAIVITGTDPEAGVVLLGAHYDSIGPVDVNSTSFQPGANDNGSGVSAGLEIARLMSQRPHRATVIIVFFSAEELGKYGSKDMVQTVFKGQNIPLRAVVNLDQMGSPLGTDGQRYDFQMRAYSASPEEEIVNSGSRELARSAEVAIRMYMPEMKLNVMGALDRPGRWGDHESFSLEGYPAIRVMEQQDNPNYVHNELDTISRIDEGYLRRTTQLVYSIMLMLADGPNPPQLRLMDYSNWKLEWSPVANAAGYIVALRYPGSLTYDWLITIQGNANTNLVWASFANYESVAVAAYYENGQIGMFSREQTIGQ